MLNKRKILILLGLIMLPSVTSAAGFVPWWSYKTETARATIVVTNRGGGQVRIDQVDYRLLISNRDSSTLRDRHKSDFFVQGRNFRKDDRNVRRNAPLRLFQIWRKAKNQWIHATWILDYPGKDPRKTYKYRNLR